MSTTVLLVGIPFVLLALFTSVIFVSARKFKVKTIWVKFDSKLGIRVAKHHPELLEMETFLREKAYENVDIEKSKKFYSDEDMAEAYQITVVYHRKTKTPLLSSRGIFDSKSILRILEGETKFESENELELIPGEEFCLFDRLSGNYEHSIYQKFRELIFAKYYAEIVRLHRTKTIFLMARSEPKERLLTKYIRIGFDPIRQTKHNGKLHWVIKSNYSDFQRLSTRNLYFRILVDFTKIFSNSKP